MLLLPALLDLAQVAVVAVLVVIARSFWSRTETFPTPREAHHARMETSDGTEWDWGRIWKIRARQSLEN
jgi:hypothetical protein